MTTSDQPDGATTLHLALEFPDRQTRFLYHFRFRLLHRKSRHILEGTKRHIWTVRDDQATSMFEIFDAEMVRAFFRMAQAGDPFEMNSN